MEIITAIDTFLKNIFVRWSLLVATVALSIGLGIQTARITATGLLLKSAKGENAQYAAKLEAQNDAIKKAADDMQAMKEQAQEANQKAADLNIKLKQRKVEIREVVLTGDCPNMVQQTIEEVRK